jgi:hypothetical protein
MNMTCSLDKGYANNNFVKLPMDKHNIELRITANTSKRFILFKVDSNSYESIFFVGTIIYFEAYNWSIEKPMFYLKFRH